MSKTHLGHTARKRFGQNFLFDEYVIDQIVTAIAPKPGQNLVEIGPGLGALTEPVANLVEHLHVVELDRDLAKRLREHPFIQDKLNVIEQDALKFDFASLTQNDKLRVFGNLPYNISTPLMFHLFSFSEHIQDMHFMLQLEVVKRLCAVDGDSLYGKLSVMAQYYCAATPVVMVPPSAFKPAPKVDSAVVQLIPHATPPVELHSVSSLELTVGTAFNQRRKTIRNSLKNLISEASLNTLDIDAERRAQTLSLVEFARIANYVYEANGE
ncbi:16S rRNA (adenine(1518)-N(6)/adenine(1519)-N(6))-dimethyltransferase RsmA [Glaciecola sp. XM2]|uniref:16S rRNA (adenine(1518)-N(6)/adenine(1519)-N(6))- dimethyltransferase RsmA n=1 Tax=Glaciecola sp. XM2 TaxID=1914931 RepID=UPI001BDEF5BD|nr:16S rRNA (adenine(1518)-N(6)/adenine(1519)-N(6))-dimethyltransferase RsmA [Glaciecola sp. XM2]MBT1451053.1 16S rRNA (adenine(1518)-N(6)/adenine(1519)-N(6))-dimethyltransferase RsmA [Glaciecola sp. XM2]